MKLLLVRHGIAEDREVFANTGEPDEKRPLTNAGRKKMKRAARGLVEVVGQLDMLATSPLARAAQTAEIIGKEYGNVVTTVVPALEPGQGYEAFLEWLQRLDDIEVVAAVGHEPHLSGLASWLLTAADKPLFEFKKGGACLLEFDGAIERGAAAMRWLLTPGQLRAIIG